MLENELLELIAKIRNQKCESNYIELKAARKGCPKLFDTFSSFSNQKNGGTIVFGIDENFDYEICGVYNADDLINRIAEQSLQMEPVIRPLCTSVTVDGKTVVSAEIAEIDNFSKPCFYKGAGRLHGSYIRVGDNDRAMTEYEVYSYEAFKKKIQDELRVVDKADEQDIITKAFEKYIIEVKTKKKNLASLSPDKIARLQGFAADGKPTLAGVLLFSEYPQAFFPQLCITAIRVSGTEIGEAGSDDRFIDNKRIDGTLTQMLDEAIMFVRNNMHTKTIISSTTGKRTDRTDYPVLAVRELIINALVHRDYSFHTDSTPVTIRMFSDRMEIENPGGLYGRMTIDMLGKMSADTRNPSIANALEILGETENRYSGIPTVINQMKEYGLPAPKFESESGVFRATLYLKNDIVGKFNNIEDEIAEYCKEPKSRAELEEHFGERITTPYLFSKHINPMIKDGRLKLTIPEKPKSKYQKYYS